MAEKVRKRHFTPTKKRLRNLPQYKRMSDEEFDDWFEETYGNENEEVETLEDMEELIDERFKKINDDYDLDDLKANDLMQLRAMLLAMVQLEDLEEQSYRMRTRIDSANVLVLEKVNRMMSALRSDISMLSEDLQLTKKIRSKSKEVSVAKRWDSLTDQAYDFYKKKMLYIFCEDCRMLLATVWLNFPDNERNIIKLNCDRCSTTHTVMLSPLYETKNKNIQDVTIP